MRRVWITDRPYPADAATIAAATAAGATEIVHGVPASLAALGVDTLGLHEIPEPEPQPQSLDPAGALATLLVVAGVLDITDAANAVGRKPEDLVAEAQAWSAGAGRNKRG
jgi:hypothetical protein